MSTTLASMFLSGAADWGVGKILDVVWRCISCSDENDDRIGNVTVNDLHCPNCHQDHLQFTNACDTTVNLSSGQIGHVGLDLVGTSDVMRRVGFFREEREGISIMTSFRADHLSRQQLLIRGELSDIDEDDVLIRSIERDLVDITEDDYFQYNELQLIGPDVTDRSGVLSYDVFVEDKYKSELAYERFLLRV